MYHDEQLYRDVLAARITRCRPGCHFDLQRGGVDKATGGLWSKVAKEYPTHQSHTGDNILADVRQARRNGLVAAHFGKAELNQYELTMLKNGGDGSMLAGVSRATRLSLARRDSTVTEASTIEVFASVFGPLLVAFAHWIICACDEAGIQDVYFLARDGQLPFHVCSRLAAEGGHNLRCHYIFASRQALHLPGCESIDQAESWLLENTPHLTLRDIAERACVPLDIVVNAAAPLIAIGSEDNIPLGKRGLLRNVVRNPSFIKAFGSAVEGAFPPAAAYYRIQGLGNRTTVALVDIGWNGRLQRSLGSLLTKAGCEPAKTMGLYLSLSCRPVQLPKNEFRGFLADWERKTLASFFDCYRPVLEAALSADHPTTIGFEVFEGMPRPVFGELASRDTQDRIALQHRTICAFVEHVVALSRAAGRALVPQTELVIDNLARFLSRPTATDGLAFEGFPFVGGQTGTDTKPICRIIRASELLNRPRDFGYWPEGTLSASGHGAAAFVRRVMRRMRGASVPS